MLKKEKITQKCRRTTEKGQWKGHHRVPQDPQVPKGSHDYVLRFPNAEHQKKNVWRWLKIKVKPCLNFRLYCALGFCLELDVKSLRIGLNQEIILSCLNRHYIENNSLRPFSWCRENSPEETKGIGWQGSIWEAKIFEPWLLTSALVHLLVSVKSNCTL